MKQFQFLVSNLVSPCQILYHANYFCCIQFHLLFPLMFHALLHFILTCNQECYQMQPKMKLDATALETRCNIESCTETLVASGFMYVMAKLLQE